MSDVPAGVGRPGAPQQHDGRAVPTREAGESRGSRPDGREVAQLARRSWAALVISGLALVALGIIVLAWPAETLTVLAILVGAALIVAGMVRLFEAFRPREEDGGKRVAYAVIGLLGIVVGVYCLKDQALTVLILALVVGAFWVVHGIADLAVAWSAPKGTPGRGLRALTGVFSLAAGIVMLAWTGLSLAVLLTLLGAWLLCYGVLLIVLAWRVRQFATAV